MLPLYQESTDMEKGNTMTKTPLILLLTGLALSGCNTVEGFGKDVRHAGGSLEESAQEHKPAAEQKPEPAPKKPVRTRTVVYR